MKDERDILIPAAPRPNTSNARTPLGQQPLVDRTAGVYRQPSPVVVPGTGVPATADGGDRREAQRGTVLDTERAPAAGPDRSTSTSSIRRPS